MWLQVQVHCMEHISTVLGISTMILMCLSKDGEADLLEAWMHEVACLSLLSHSDVGIACKVARGLTFSSGPPHRNC